MGDAGSVKEGWHMAHGMTSMTHDSLSATAVATVLLIAFAAGHVPAGEPNSPDDYFAIQVVDRQTGRGVPLVELRTTNMIRYFTDSHGLIAFHEPGLMDREVFFVIESHGYDSPKDGFGIRGVRLRTTPGAAATVQIDRINVAERLYRITGQGIYRASILLGRPVPLKNPLLNGQVMGQDSVFTCLYRGRIFWMWGDTGKPSYPLGNFAMSGAVSDLPGHGGLDSSVGVDLEYFVGTDGFSRQMAPLKEPGMIWLDGLLTVADREGNERMVAKFARLKSLTETLERGLMVFNDATNTFEPLVRPGLEFLPYRNTGHAFPVQVAGRPYYYFTTPTPMGPRMRVPAQWDAVIDANQYEVLTALVREDRGQKTMDRVVSGIPFSESRWVRFGEVLASLDTGKAAVIEALEAEAKGLNVYDIESGKAILPHNGTVYFNAWRQRWVGIFTQLYGESSALGEIWYAEADTPVGPWAYTRKIMTHDKYSFYNPKHHPLFDQDGGRTIYLEGTYTWTFSGTEDKATPRYDYNQIMYRLDLADPRMVLPVAVYQVRDGQSGHRYLLGDAVRETKGWDDVESVAFYAVEPGRGSDRMIAVYAEKLPEGGIRLTTRPADPSAKALFHALPPTGSGPAGEHIVPLHEYRHADSGGRIYSKPPPNQAGWSRGQEPLCQVWRVPPGPVVLEGQGRPARNR
jgi:hypothetical protein